MKKTVNNDNNVMKKTKNKNIDNIIIHVANINFDVSIDEDVYDKYEIIKIKNIIKMMSKDIWIDKTYTNFPRNIFNDSYIEYEKWNEFISFLNDTKFGKKTDDDGKEFIMCTIYTLAIFYMYGILEKYDYSVEDINISIPQKNHKPFIVEYIKDNRKSWRF